MCRNNPHQGIPSTTVTAPHVTQGRVDYESTIPRGTDEELDLWEAPYVLGEMIMGTFKIWVIVVLFIKLEVCKDLGLVLKEYICSGLGLVQIAQMQCYIQNFGFSRADIFYKETFHCCFTICSRISQKKLTWRAAMSLTHCELTSKLRWYCTCT